MPETPDTLPANFFNQQQAQPSQPQPQQAQASNVPDSLPADFFSKQQAQPQQQEQAEAQPKSYGIMDELYRQVEGAKGFAKGIYQFANNISSAMGANALEDKLTGGAVTKAQKQYADYITPQNKEQKAGAFFGRNAPLLLTPEAEGGMLSKALYNAAIGAISGASDSGSVKDAAIGGALGGVMGPLSSLMGKYARSLYSTAINPTKLDAKAATASTLLNGSANDLVGRGIWGVSLRSLHQQLSTEAAQLGQKVEQTISKLDKQGTLNFQTILQAAQGEIDNPNGKFKYVTPHTGKLTDATVDKYASALDTMHHVIDMVQQDGQNLNGVTYKTAQFIRQRLDESIWGDKLTPDLKQEAKKFSYYLANLVRDDMNSGAPDLKAINNDYHVIKTAVRAIGYTLERKTGQQGVGTKLDSMIGEQLGNLLGHPLAGLAVGAAQKSTAYRTGGAVLMDRASKHTAKASAALGKFAADQWNKISTAEASE